MTSNYDKYVRPEVWPIPAEAVGYLVEGRNLPGGMVEIRCAGDVGEFVAGRVFVLDAVPREHVRGAIAAISAYCQACRKLIG
jgi:hypothetical protein